MINFIKKSIAFKIGDVTKEFAFYCQVVLQNVKIKLESLDFFVILNNIITFVITSIFVDNIYAKESNIFWQLFKEIWL